MKTDIHPDYQLVTVHCSCGNDFETRSTATELRVELCSECHPFYTGKQKLVDTGGRIDRFERRYGRRKKSGGAAEEEASEAADEQVGAVEGPPAGAAAADVVLGDAPVEDEAPASDEAAADETAESSDS